MIAIVSLIAIGVSAFTATNIDDIFVLVMSLSSLNFPVRQVILGQYVGIDLLVAISALGSLISLVIPTYIIGLLLFLKRLRYCMVMITSKVESRKNNLNCRKFWLNNPLSNCSCYAVPNIKGPIKFTTAAITAACIGLKTLVPTTVAIEFAES
jgi:hypothetical protein